MKKILLLIPSSILLATGAFFAASFMPAGRPGSFSIHTSKETEAQRLQSYAAEAKLAAAEKGYNTGLCFLLDMSLPSGQKRFFVYNLKENKIIYAGMVAHGSCNTSFLDKARFSNQPGCGCSAKGKYKVGYKYDGRFGPAYKLYGLDTSNSNAYDRYIVLHSYYLVPDVETDTLPICNSLGCAMVSKNFLKQLEVEIDGSKKPVLLWMFE